MKLIEGLKLEVNETFIACHITQLTEELKEGIRVHLQNICHGKGLVSKGLLAHSYLRTLQNFRDRYVEKTVNIKKGMIGELLTHYVVHDFLDDFDVVSPFFNMEEKSQRKGFDLLLTTNDGQEVWITEVKSGEINSIGCPDRATRGFLHTAKRDLKKRLNEPEETFWLNAINTAQNAILGCTDYKDAVLKILDEEAVSAADDKASGLDNNVILVSVLFFDINKPFEIKNTEEVSHDIAAENLFNKVITFSIQKGTYENIAKFLFEEELDGV